MVRRGCRVSTMESLMRGNFFPFSRTHALLPFLCSYVCLCNTPRDTNFSFLMYMIIQNIPSCTSTTSNGTSFLYRLGLSICISKPAYITITIIDVSSLRYPHNVQMNRHSQRIVPHEMLFLLISDDSNLLCCSSQHQTITFFFLGLESSPLADIHRPR
jgi:hypothetical protein